MKQKLYTLTIEQIKEISKIMEKEEYAYDKYSDESKYSLYINQFGRKKIVYYTEKNDFGISQFLETISKDCITLLQGSNFTDIVDVYCINSLNPKLLEQREKEILNSTGLQIRVFDLNFFKSFKNDRVKQYLSSIWNIDNNQPTNIDGVQKALFDILASGKESTDIKNNLLHSVIVLIIYKEGNHAVITELKNKVSNQLGKDVGNFDIVLQQMSGQQIIKYDRITKKHVSLSDEIYQKVEFIVKEAQSIELEFKNRFYDILNQYDIREKQLVLEKLISLYQLHFAYDSTEEYEKRADSAYKALYNLIKDLVDSEKAKELINDIRQLCEDNSYLDSISATSSFIGMYQLNQLDEYINSKQKCIILDTPLLVYLLCYKALTLPSHYDWQNAQYKSARDLYELHTNKSSSVLLYTMEDYVQESVGEYKKALQMGWLESITDIEFLKLANNIFYNYYRYLMDNPELYDDSDKVKCFDDFAKEVLGFNNTCIDSNNIDSDTTRYIKTQIEGNYGIIIETFRSSSESEIEDNTKRYQGTLDHSKSQFACAADAKTLLLLSRIGNMKYSDDTKESELYISTWDRSFDKFRTLLFNEGCPNRFFISTPAKIVNKVMLANFDINNTCITNDVFLFAESNFDLKNKVVGFVNKVAPIFGKKNTTNKFYNEVLNWYKEQVENETNNEMSQDKDSYTFKESFVLSLFDSLNKELKPEQINQLTNDDKIDREVKQIFLRYKKDYTTELEVKDNVAKMINDVKKTIEINGTSIPSDPMLY